MVETKVNVGVKVGSKFGERRINPEVVYKIFAEHGPMTVRQASELSGIDNHKVGCHINRLSRDGFVKIIGLDKETGARAANIWQVTEEKAVFEDAKHKSAATLSEETQEVLAALVTAKRIIERQARRIVELEEKESKLDEIRKTLGLKNV